MHDPLVGLAVAGSVAKPADVARALAASLSPPRATDAPPPWLDDAQADAFRLLLHALRTHGAVLCADPVGTGKTFIALAIAQALGPEPPACLVPAPLVHQWRSTAQRLGVPAIVWSHSQLSLGRLPPGAPTLVIVDESHHFRRPAIRRYQTLAPWLLGRRVLLVSATPVVNGPADLHHQLHLGLRDDALALDGAPSMRVAFARKSVPPALGRFVIQRLDPSSGPVSRCHTAIVASGATPLLPALDDLVLSTNAGIAALVRSVLLHAAASSAAALLAALRRYRNLLLHARDALQAGRPPDRQSLRRLTARSEEQLLLWALMPEIAAGDELRLDDLPALEALIAETRRVAEHPDAKTARLEALLQDRVPTLVFVTARETIMYLRSQLPDRWLAWCTGARAGIGATALPRHEVLAWFRPDVAALPPQVPGQPRTLLTTDVTAEGLDLQAAGRVVHYDLPWTDVRLAQRNGRAVRRGSTRSEVQIVRFLPSEAIEQRLHQQEILIRKSGLPSRHGLGSEGRQQWRWRRELAEALRGPGIEGTCTVHSAVDGVLAGLALNRAGEQVVSTVIWGGEGTEWTDDPMVVEARLLEAARAPGGPPPSSTAVREILSALTPRFRSLLHEASIRRIAGTSPRPAALRLGRRVRALATRAARHRDATLLGLLDRALAFCAGGHTAGEALLVEVLLALDDEELITRLPGLPAAAPRPAPLHPRLTGLIIFRRCRMPVTYMADLPTP